MTRTLSIALIFTFLLALLAAAGPATNPQEAARLNNIGVAYMNQQLFGKALKAFEEAAANDPALQVATVNRGVALLNLQRGDQAKTLLEKEVKNNPKDAHAWYNLGLYYKNSSDAGSAIDAFRRVTEIDASDADTWYFLGSTCAQLKQFPEAIDAFEHALKIDPLHASAQFGLARAYQQSGQADPAHEAMKKFQYITQNKLGAPISLSYGEQGKYSRAEESPVAVEKVAAAIPVRFVDVTQNVGLLLKLSAPTSNEIASSLGPGACFLDYDNDGRIDLLLADNGPEGGLALFHNVAGGFEDATRRAGLDPTMHAIGCTTGDYDNDGFADIALTVNGRVLLLHNEKNGTFKDVTESAGIKSQGFNIGVNFIDYDHDGDIDLYVTGDSVGPWAASRKIVGASMMWRNNGNGTFTDVTDSVGLKGDTVSIASVGTDYNNDRAVDIVVTGSGVESSDGARRWASGTSLYENPREGAFHRREPWIPAMPASTAGVAVLDFDHDGWMDIAFTHPGLTGPMLSLWRNKQGKTFEQVSLPKVDWARAYGITAIDYDNDGWVDLVAVGETKDGKGEVRLFRNLGPDGFKDVTAETGLDKIQLKEPRAIIAGDYDNDGATDLLITQNHGPAVLLHNEGGNKNNSLRLALKGLNDNKSAIGTKVEVFSAGLRQKFEVYGSSGYLGQNSPYLTIGLGQAKEADVVRMTWPTGVLQDEIGVAANKVQNFTEMDRRGSSCPTLFAWDGTHYELVGDMLGAGVVGHWIAAGDGKVAPQGLKPAFFQALNGTAEAVPYPKPIYEASSKIVRNIARPTEAIKLDRRSLREKDGKLSFRFMEPLEESVYLDQVQLLAVDHPADVDVYPNEYFASNPPYPPFKVVFSRDARPPAGAWDEHGHNVLPDLLAHRYFGDFKVLSFTGFTEPHSLELDLGEPYRGGPLWLLLHGEIEYFSATSMYAADQAHLRPFAPYVEAQVLTENDAKGKWVRVVDDMGFPAGGARTMTANLTGKLPPDTRRIRITTNLQIYWDNILISRASQDRTARLTPMPLVRAELNFHGFPLKIEDEPPGNVKYIYEKASATGPYTRPAGAYTRYGDVRPLLDSIDDKFVVFGSGDEVALDFDPVKLPALPRGWVRDYFFVANGYEKDMDFYAYHGDTVDPLPFRDMRTYPYPGQSFPSDAEHVNYLLEYNTRFMSANEGSGYSFRYTE
ncbi:MAG TPA: FG-GAP-like repeat-containing protein [Terriglobales bacterium]|nr:FG-GAP-like repeat-containing protein [Terriglobales bacterium]